MGKPDFCDRAAGVGPDRQLKLTLRAGECLPTNLCWLIDDGYLLLSGWQRHTEITALGIWGPGSLVMPASLAGGTLQLTSLSSVQVQEWIPSLDEMQQFRGEQIQQLTSLLLFSRIRPAEERLFQLLIWLGQRFGRVSSRGVGLSFLAMNLTHQNLAEISGLTRVTVTKALTSFRREGRLIREGDDELLRADDNSPSSGGEAQGRRPANSSGQR